MREKLIELLRGFFESVYPEFVYESLVDHLIAHGVTVQEDCKACAEATQNCIVNLQEQIAKLRSAKEWISTDERLPTEDDATDGYVAVVYAWGDGIKTKTISLVDVVIAHPDLYDYWMPLNLPQPPKGE